MAKNLEHIVKIDGIDCKLNEAEYNLYLESCIPIYNLKPNQKLELSNAQKSVKNYHPIYYHCEPLDASYHQRRIIKKYCIENEILIPKNLSKKNSSQIKGLFRGMTKQYGVLYKTHLDNIF